MKYKALLIVTLFWLTSASVGQAKDGHFIKQQSGPTTVAVLELYTSEGCYNCPAAERYLKQISEKYTDNKQFIPLAFHVDYWDYIGWEDPYSDPAHGMRQRETAQRNKLNSLYTPQFVLYGKDFPAYNNIPEAIGIINEIKPRADIAVQASLKDTGLLDTVITIKARDERTIHSAHVFIAISENKLSSQVTEGENEGLHLQHDHVVRKFIGPFTLQGQGTIDIKQQIKLDTQWKLADLSLVVFSQDNIDGTTHQAIRVPLHELKAKQ